jgi:DNA repair exonuclease SbcCD ATPase subunit
MIQIKKLNFSNILSYGEDNEVTLDDSSVTQILGVNGAGKSSIPTILEEVFYNKNSRGIKKDALCNRYTDNPKYSISAEFSVDGIEYKIDKQVTKTAKVKLYKEGEDISGHTATQTYGIIESVIGLDFTTFTKLVYQSMTSSLDFLSATDANRKKFLVGLLGLEKYSELENSVKTELKLVKQNLAEIQGSVNTIETWIKNNGNVGEEKHPVSLPKVEEELSESITDFKAKKLTLTKLNKEIDNFLSTKETLEGIVKTEIAVVPSPEKDYDQLTKEKISLTTLVSAKKREVKELEAVKDTCPTCGQSIEIGDTKERLDLLTRETETLQKQLDQTVSCVSEALASKREYENYLSKLSSREKAEERLNNLEPPETLEKMEESEVSYMINYLEDKLKDQRKLLEEATAHNRKVELHNQKVEITRQTLAKYTVELEDNMAKLRETQEIKDLLDILAQALGSKGLIAFKIEFMVKAFEDLINKYLQALADGRFALGFSIEDTKLALKLYDNGQEVDIKSLSSGERNRVNSATLLAIRKMLTSVSKVNINVLFLDEVVSVLDKQGKDTLIEVLLNENDLNSLVVSHEYSHPLARKINVVKKDKISCIDQI